MSTIDTIGKVLDPKEVRRDAIHVAIAPVTAGERLRPGARVGFGPTERPGEPEDAVYLAGGAVEFVGIVDPFLPGPVGPGERVWLFLPPGTIVDLRHVWSSPVFTARAAAARAKVLSRSEEFPGPTIPREDPAFPAGESR